MCLYFSNSFTLKLYFSIVLWFFLSQIRLCQIIQHGLFVVLPQYCSGKFVFHAKERTNAVKSTILEAYVPFTLSVIAAVHSFLDGVLCISNYVLSQVAFASIFTFYAVFTFCGLLWQLRLWERNTVARQ